MSAPALPVEAVRCQIGRIVEFALAHDRARLPIRASLRDALDAIERPGVLRVVSLPRDRRSEHNGRRI